MLAYGNNEHILCVRGWLSVKSLFIVDPDAVRAGLRLLRCFGDGCKQKLLFRATFESLAGIYHCKL